MISQEKSKILRQKIEESEKELQSLRQQRLVKGVIENEFYCPSENDFFDLPNSPTDSFTAKVDYNKVKNKLKKTGVLTPENSP